MRFTKDGLGLPGVWADDDVGALFGLGLLHGLHRPLQSLLLPHAGAGRLMARLVPAAALRHLDSTAHHLDLPRRGAHTARSLSDWAQQRVRSYLAGMKEGLRRSPASFATRQIVRLLGAPSPEDLCAGFLLSSYLGLSEGQARMEKLLVEALGQGADARLLEAMFAPHLSGWDPQALAELAAGGANATGFGGLSAVGGSNAWALGGKHTASGQPILAADPHLQINQMPALFYEVRVRLPADYWIGASIPGLPGIAVGRNRNLAWSGTFSVADNVDHFIEPEDVAAEDESVTIPRRGLPGLRLPLRKTARGTLRSKRGGGLSSNWSGHEEAWQAMQAYLRLPSCSSAAQAHEVLGQAHTLSLHFVLADRGGAVHYRQVGRIPKRSEGWSGLWPAPVGGPQWQGSFRAEDLPAFESQEGIVVSANEARPGPGGATLSTLAQPEYRRRRILQLLKARSGHDLRSMEAIQQDLLSGQAQRLLPALLPWLPEGPLRRALLDWNAVCAPSSVGAHAFSLVYRAALSALATDLGGAWFDEAVQQTEVSVWWAHGLDRALAQAAHWPTQRQAALADRLKAIAGLPPRPWGQVQQLSMPHLVFGGLPDVLGYDRGPFALPGSVSTVCQGNLLKLGEAPVAVGPAYRFITDLGEDEAQSSLPGGVDGSPASASYDCFLEQHLRGQYHRLTPPADDEALWFTCHLG